MSVTIDTTSIQAAAKEIGEIVQQGHQLAEGFRAAKEPLHLAENFPVTYTFGAEPEIPERIRKLVEQNSTKPIGTAFVIRPATKLDFSDAEGCGLKFQAVARLCETVAINKKWNSEQESKRYAELFVVREFIGDSYLLVEGDKPEGDYAAVIRDVRLFRQMGLISVIKG